MNKDDILAMSRKENQGADEYEKYVLEKASRLASQVGLLVCCAIAVVHVSITGRVSSVCWIIYFSIYATLFWTKYRYLRKRHELMMAVISTAVGLLFTGLFVWDMMKYL